MLPGPSDYAQAPAHDSALSPASTFRLPWAVGAINQAQGLASVERLFCGDHQRLIDAQPPAAKALAPCWKPVVANIIPLWAPTTTIVTGRTYTSGRFTLRR